MATEIPNKIPDKNPDKNPDMNSEKNPDYCENPFQSLSFEENTGNIDIVIDSNINHNINIMNNEAEHHHRRNRCARWCHHHSIVRNVLLILYLFIIPFIMVVSNEISFWQATAALLAMMIVPTILLYLNYIRMQFTEYMTSEQKINTTLKMTCHQWPWELYQGILTMISCATYILYTYKCSYVEIQMDEKIQAYGYVLAMQNYLDTFVMTEYFLVSSFGLDYFVRFIEASDKMKFVRSVYNALDILCITGVAYFSFAQGQLVPEDSIYNYYLLLGFVRFLRFRRSLQTLDKPVTNHSQQYELGPMIISRFYAKVALLAMRITLLVFSSAAIILALEFPCLSLVHPWDTCLPDMQRFNLTVYFIVISFVTCGYGDLYAVTDLGRMFMTFIIVVAVIRVPVELAAFSSIADDNVGKHTSEAIPFPSTSPGTSQQSPDPAFSDVDKQFSSFEPLLTIDDDQALKPLLVWSELQLLRNHSPRLLVELCKVLFVQTDERHAASALTRALFVHNEAIMTPIAATE